MYENLSDEQLVISAQQGDMCGAEEILRRYKPIVIKCSRQYFLIGAEQDDLIQEGMIGLYRATLGFKIGENKFASYAYACVRSSMLDAIKRAGRNKHAPLNTYSSLHSDDTGVEIISDLSTNPEEIVIKNMEINELLERVKSVLSKSEKIVFDYFIEGFTMRECAKNLKKDVKYVDNALQRIKSKVRKIANGKI